VFVDGATAHQVFFKAQAELELVVDHIQYFFGFGHDFRANAVARE